MSAPIYNQLQDYNGKTYSVAAVLELARNIPEEIVDIRLIDKYYNVSNITSNQYDLEDFAAAMKRVLNADLKYPILIYRGFIMDGKHRLTKAIYLGKKTIKAKVLKELPIEIK